MKKVSHLITTLGLIGSLQACTVLMHGPMQEIPITSQPSGASIFVDGQPQGYTPARISVSRKEAHIIRLQQHGYTPVERTLTSELDPWLFANILILPGFIPDLATKSGYQLTPEQVHEQMSPMVGRK